MGDVAVMYTSIRRCACEPRMPEHQWDLLVFRCSPTWAKRSIRGENWGSTRVDRGGGLVQCYPTLVDTNESSLAYRERMCKWIYLLDSSGQSLPLRGF